MNLLATIFVPATNPQNLRIRNELLKNIWTFNNPATLSEPKAESCFLHYQRLLEDPRALDEAFIDLQDSPATSKEIINLIQRLKRDVNQPLNHIRSSLQNSPPAWLRAAQHIDPEATNKALTFASRLWLFTRLDLTDGNVTLATAAKTQLEKIKGAATRNFMWLEFSARTLTQKAGMQIVWTSDLSEHLTFESRSSIRVFTHASVLQRFEKTMEKQIYPHGFLEELGRTLNLLWPMEDRPMEKYVRSLEKHENIDVEANMWHDDKFNLESYPIFGERLAKIQERLEAVQTRKGVSLGFHIAIWGIVLTALFGLISAITGIMQVWASFQSLKEPSPATPQT